MHKGEMSF